MLKPAAFICFTLTLLSPVCVGAEQQNTSVRTPQKDGAERVFATAASKVVFLITRKSGVPHTRASGIILTADGYIATNYHALQGGDAVEIRFFPNTEDSETYQSFNGAKLLYADAERDIAILKVSSKALPFLECPIRTDGRPRIGQSVYAIGNPRGLTNTISEGIVSSLRVDAGEEIIQHTAAISPGSSGGALVNSNGDLLGMNSWQVADAQNLNFAISAIDVLQGLTEARNQRSPMSFPSEDLPQAVTSQPNSKSVQAQESAKDRAVSQMRKIVEAIKQCPEMAPNDFEFARAIQKFTAPLVQDWDVVTSDSLRSPFQGFVRFRIVSHYEESEAAKRSKQLDADYRFFIQTMKWCEEEYHTSCNVTEYRHEFDLGSDTPELRKASMSTAINKEPIVYEPRGNSCWDNIARSPGSVLAHP